MNEVNCSKCGRSLLQPDGSSRIPLQIAITEKDKSTYPELAPGDYRICFGCLLAALGLIEKKGNENAD